MYFNNNLHTVQPYAVALLIGIINVLSYALGMFAGRLMVVNYITTATDIKNMEAADKNLLDCPVPGDCS